MTINVPVQEFADTTSVTEIEPEALRGSKTSAGFEHWRSLCGTRRFPSRHEIKPSRIARVLTNIVLVKVIDGGMDFQFRVIGDHAGRGYGVNLTNRLLSDVANDLPRAAAVWRDLYGRVVADARPRAVHVRVGRDAPDANYTQAEAVFLPLGEDDRVDHILSFVEHVLKT